MTSTDQPTPCPPLPAVGRPILIHALSGLGKSTLAARYPKVTHDTDLDLDTMLAEVFPEHQGRARRIAWRALCRSQPWTRPTSPDFDAWSRGRRSLVDAVLTHLQGPGPLMVVSNLLMLPWPVTRYHGVALGGYAWHWAGISREADNGQDEALNARLEGYAPLRRLPVGHFLGDEPELVGWLEEAARVTAL